MRSFVTLRLISIAATLLLGGGACAQAQSGISAVWVNDGGDKVLAEERRASGGLAVVPAHGITNAIWDGKQISLAGARNESLGFVVVLESAAGARDITVRLDRLEGPGGAVIGSRAARGDEVFDYRDRHIELFRVGYLPIKGLSMLSYELNDERWVPSKMRRPFQVVRHGTTWRAIPQRGKESFTDRPGAGKSFPEIAIPLEAGPALTIPANGSQSVWADVYIPKASPPGTYRGTLVVAERGAPDRSLPVVLTVRGFTLPDRPSGIATAAIGHYDIAERFLGVERRFQDPGSNDWPKLLPILERYSQMLHRHRVVPMLDEGSGIAPPRPETAARITGTLYSAAKGYDGPGKDTGDAVFFIGPYSSWKWKPGNQAEYNRQTDAWMTWFAVNAPRTQKYLYLTDEPNVRDVVVAREINGWLDKLAANPGIGRNLPTFITVSVPHGHEHIPRVGAMASWYSLADTQTFQRAFDAHLKRAPGNEVWQYNGKRPATGSFAIEDDGVALSVVQWAAFKKGIAGWFYWNSSYYYDYQNGAGRTDVWRQAKTFGPPPRPHREIGETGSTNSNGDGVLLYPGIDQVFPDTPAPGLAGPVASLRLKLWRRGIQDYDYLTLAMQKDPAATRAVVDRMVPKVLWEVGAFNRQDPTYQFGGEGDGIGWSTNPDDWEAARRRLAAIIEGAR